MQRHHDDRRIQAGMPPLRREGLGQPLLVFNKAGKAARAG